jgi:hypothetical protein
MIADHCEVSQLMSRELVSAAQGCLEGQQRQGEKPLLLTDKGGRRRCRFWQG